MSGWVEGKILCQKIKRFYSENCKNWEKSLGPWSLTNGRSTEVVNEVWNTEEIKFLVEKWSKFRNIGEVDFTGEESGFFKLIQRIEKTSKPIASRGEADDRAA